MTDAPEKAILDRLDNAEIVEADFNDDPVPDYAPQPPEVQPGEGAAPSRFSPIEPVIVKDCAALDQNDTDNGRRLINHFGRDILFVREVGPHVWNGSHWNAEGGQEGVERFAQEVARRIKLESADILPSKREAEILSVGEGLAERAAETLSEAEKVALRAANEVAARLAKRKSDRYKFAVSCGNRARTVAMIAQAVPHCSIAPAALDADPMKFNVQNGTLVFRKHVEDVDDPECPDPDIRRTVRRVRVGMVLAPHDRAALIAKIAPINHDPHARCRVFLRFLRRMQPDRSLRKYLQTAIGRALLGGAATQVLIFLYGDGANGKSVFMEVFSRLLGNYSGRLKPETISGTTEGRGDQATPDLARLAGKRFVAIAELPRGMPLREGLVKTVTGGEEIPVRHLNKGFFDMLPEFIPFMSGNEMPDIGGLDEGIWRRLKFVHWPVKVPEAERRPFREMVEELLTESPGILNWAIEGALRFLRDGLQEPPSVTVLTQEHRGDLDPVGAFLRACVRTRTGGEVQARLMYLAFVAFCEANAIRPWKEKSFSMALKKKGLVRDDKRIRTWLDVELHDVPARMETRGLQAPGGDGA